jgi:light-regulated signal transduction histidine kinase (bacteriophytochrome)
MNNGTTTETVRDLEALVASLTELIDVQEKVVSEQSERLKQNEEALRESNDRFLAFIKEAAMRLKNPLEVVEENLAIVVNDIEHSESEPQNVSLQLRIQIKNLEQIRKNIIELNQAIVDHSGEMSDASKQFLTG